ncbi:MAG: hypothetical protein NC928_00680 [Candidatus Omnitrophica bacterium]|nr:hypothetical protein [Candidatus Omnitrophota bacterium]
MPGIFCLFFLFSLFGLFYGFFLSLKPHLAIEIQRRFYRRINWNLEPISIEKEIRNTRIMGGFLIVISLAIFAYILKYLSF